MQVMTDHSVHKLFPLWASKVIKIKIKKLVGGEIHFVLDNCKEYCSKHMWIQTLSNKLEKSN